MAKKPTISTISSGYASNTQLNNNFSALRTGFDNTLSLDGSTPNAMNADFDMNSNDILNANEINTSSLRLNGVLVSASGEVDVTSSIMSSDVFTGNGSTTVYTLSFAPFIKDNTQIYIDGVYQNKITYATSGNTLTFTEAPPLNSAIEVMVARILTDVGTADAGSVTYTQGGSGSVQTTVQAKLQESLSVKDFGATGDGVADDTTAILAAIAYLGSNARSLLVTSPLKISSNITFSLNTQVVFVNGGKFVGTTGSEIVTLQRQPVADIQQIFDNVDAYFTTDVTLSPEWFGAVKDGSTDDRQAFIDALYSIRNVGGLIQLQSGDYAVSDSISINYSNITIQGAGNNTTYVRVTGSNKNGIIINGVSGTPIRNTMLRDFSLILNTVATSSCIGIYSYYSAFPIIERMQIQDFLKGLGMEGSTNSQITKVGTTYTGSTNGFIGFDIYGGASGSTGGNPSSILKDCYSSGVAGLTGQIGFKIHGSYMSDIQFDTCETALTNYGFQLDYGIAPDFNVDIIIRNPIVDRYFLQGIIVQDLASNGVLQIIGGYSNPDTTGSAAQNMYFDTCLGAINVIGHEFMALTNIIYTDGIFATSCTGMTISNNLFTKLNKGVRLTSCGYSLLVGNVFRGGNPSAFSKMVEVIGGARVMVNSNSFDGATEGVSIDVTSDGCGIVGNTANVSTVGTRFTNAGTNTIGGATGSTGLNSGV
jgi:hypothetical protein